MTLVQFVTLYVLTVPVFFAIDLLWLGVVAKRWYRQQLGVLLGPVRWVPAIIFYLLYIVGILIFAVLPAVTATSLPLAAGLGSVFGFFAYATYDLTNLATIKGWPGLMSLVDMVWGTVLTGIVATVSYMLAQVVVL